MNQSNAFDILAPTDQLPAEGHSEEPVGQSALDRYIAALGNSEIGFDISSQGIEAARTIPGGEVFQQFTIGDDEFAPTDDAFQIDLSEMISDTARFDDLSDAAEPEDYVRRFLEAAGRSLDSNDELTAENVRHVPLIRWKADDNGARIQLMGILRATDEQFTDICESQSGTYTAILEDAEVEGHGLREVGMALAILGISLAAAPEAEAGLFKKAFQKHRAAKAERKAEKKAVRRVKAPVQRSASGYVDAHEDAKINTELLRSAVGTDAQRQIVVDVAKQRAYLIIDGQVAIDTAVSTARTGKETPRGEFKITEKIRTGKRSTIYGCEMPCWMRLDGSAYGLHVGDLPGRPASAGCVRLPHSVAPVLFEHAMSGTVVQIVDAWQPNQPADGMLLSAVR